MIGTEVLRKKVIELAIQGKLTQQLPEDGNAEDLYAQIQKEKAKLIKEGKIKKEKPLPEISDDEILFEIPSNWKWMRIADVVMNSLGGGTPSKKIPEYWNDGDIPWISVKDFSSAESGYLCDTIDHITQDGLDNSASNLIDEDAIVICMRMALGKIVRLSRPMAINQDLRAIWLYECINESYFVYFYSALKIVGRGTTVSGIRKEELMNYLIPLPPLSEQKRIVEKLNDVLAQIDIIDALQQQYESDREILKGKIIDAGIRGKLTQQLPEDGNAEDLYAQIQEEKTKLIKEGKIKKGKPLPEVSGDEIPFEIPSNWKWVLLGDTSYVERGGSPRPIKSYITDSETGINWIKIGDVEKGGKYIFRAKERIIPEGEKKSRHVYPGDFLLTNSMSFGRPYISMIEGCIHDGWLLIRDLDAYNVDYLYHLLSSNYMYSQFCNKASGATVDNLNIDKVNTALVPLPPKSEQFRIANRIDGLFKTIDHETERGLLWKTTKKVSHSSFRN